MIVSLLLGLCSMIVSLGGMKFIKIGSATDQSKAKIAVGGGVLSILAGESENFLQVFHIKSLSGQWEDYAGRHFRQNRIERTF